MTLTRKAGLMEAQVEVLDGKAKVLGRYRDAMHDVATAIAAIAASMPAVEEVPAGADGAPGEDGAAGPAAPEEAVLPPAVSRMVLSAQEDLRREIARAMHDGPAQSLTNIVLQAQIVDRLLSRDPEQARGEIRQLVAMVQSTLDATKSFIFDVRPMVLDDLGLVPTLRRAARERGRRAHVPVEFDSFGTGPADGDGGRGRPLPDHRRDARGVPLGRPGPGDDPARLGRAGRGPGHRRADERGPGRAVGAARAVGLAGDPGPRGDARRSSPSSWPRGPRCGWSSTGPPRT